MEKVILVPLTVEDREQFISDNQEAFNYGALEEFGVRDTHYEEEGQIISRETIGRAIDEGTAYRIKRNIHFYVNRCGFHIVEFWNEHHVDEHDCEDDCERVEDARGGMFRFEKRMGEDR